MSAATAPKITPPQAFICTYAPRLRAYGNPLLTPVQPTVQPPTNTRTTKRGTTAINYAEDGYDDDDFDESEGPRVRPTGLRSLRREETNIEKLPQQPPQLGRETYAPVTVQGIWRDWMTKPDTRLSDRSLQIQAHLPTNLIPIRIDLEIPSFRPDAALPTPNNAREFGIDESLPAYRQPEVTPVWRLHDFFLWNLHEAMLTPDMFARKFVDEMDFPGDRKVGLVVQIANQIRTQLEDYAGIAMHPLFHLGAYGNGIASTAAAPAGNSQIPPTSAIPSGPLTPSTPAPLSNPAATASTNPQSSTSPTALPTPTQPQPQSDTQQPQPQPQSPSETPNPISTITATAHPLTDLLNPDDAYRCIISLNIPLSSRLYSDRFEWSLLHPPGLAETFAKHTCADFGLAPEWSSLIAHAIYEAVLRLKKEVCESGGMGVLGLVGEGYGYGEVANDCVDGDAGWRYEPERLAEDWEPRIEALSKEEIEKREGDRERQLRRLRRETARWSSTAGVHVQTSLSLVQAQGQQQQPQNQGNYFEVDASDQPMGRGERSKKKRRFRSLSPPAGRDTPDGGYGGQSALRDEYVLSCPVLPNMLFIFSSPLFSSRLYSTSSPSHPSFPCPYPFPSSCMHNIPLIHAPCQLCDPNTNIPNSERQAYRCTHCYLWGQAVWAVRDGPAGPRSLCHNCGFLYERDGRLPPWSKEFFKWEGWLTGLRR